MTIQIFNSLLTMTTALRLSTDLNSIPKNNILIISLICSILFIGYLSF